MREETGLRRIKFPFHPFQFEQKSHAIEKELDGKKRRYLQGVASGLKTDGHGERMTEDCIKSFLYQGNSGDILLYPDTHEIKASEDIGIMVKAEIMPNGDWFTEFRLYDVDDDIGSVKQEKINNIWKQLIGAKPYKKPKQKGFSVEGYVPEDGILELSTNGKRVLNNVELDGVVLVPRPAYKSSITNVVYKALDEFPYWQGDKVTKNIQGKLQEIISKNLNKNAYHEDKYNLEWAIEEELEIIMKDMRPYKKERLEIIFDEFKNKMVELVIKSKTIFTSENNDSKDRTKQVFKELLSNYNQLKEKLGEKT